MSWIWSPGVGGTEVLLQAHLGSSLGCAAQPQNRALPWIWGCAVGPAWLGWHCRWLSFSLVLQNAPCNFTSSVYSWWFGSQVSFTSQVKYMVCSTGAKDEIIKQTQFPRAVCWWIHPLHVHPWHSVPTTCVGSLVWTPVRRVPQAGVAWGGSSRTELPLTALRVFISSQSRRL